MAEPSLLSNLAEEDLNSVFGPAPTEPAPTEPAPTEPATGGGLLLNLSEQELNKALGVTYPRDPVYERELEKDERRTRLTWKPFLETTRRGSRVEQERLYKQYMAGREGVNLVQRDESPLGFMDRLQLYYLNDADAQVEKLNQKILKDPRIDPTKHQARYSPSTGLIIPQYNEESGQVEDVVVDPDGVDWANVAGFIAPNLIPLAGEAATALTLAKRTSMAAGSLRRLTAQSAAGAGAGQVQEAATRLLSGVSQDEIADTLTEFGLETASGILLDAIATRTGKLVTPFGDVALDPEREEALAAAKRLGIAPNVGEQTGSPFFGKLESFLRKQWALGGKLERLELDRQNQILDQLAGLQPSIMPQGYRSTYLPTKDLFDSIDKQLYDESVDSVARAREISGVLTEEAMRTVGAQPVGVRISSVADAGKTLRNHLNVTLEAFRKQADKNYGEVATTLRLAKRTTMAADSWRRLITQSAAGAGAGQVQEAATRLLSGVSQDEMADTLTEFGLETGAGFILDALVSKGGQAVTPFGDMAINDPTRKKALESAKRLGLSPSVGEETGSSFAGKMENFLRKQWALGTRLERAEIDRQNQILDQLAGLQPGIMPQGYRSTYLPTKDLFDSIDKQLYDEAVDNVARAREISGALTEEAMRTVGAQPVGVRISSVADAGKALRNHLNVTLNAFRKQANKNYGEVDRLIKDYTQAYGNQFDFDRLVKFPDLAGLERELKKGDKYVTTGTTTFRAPDPSGIGFTTVTKDVDVEKTLPSRLNKKVTSILSDLKKVHEGMSIDTARKKLREVNNSISASNGFNFAGLGTDDVRILKDIRARLIQALDDAASSMPNQSLKNAMEKANFDYSKSADALKSSQIQDILQDSKGKRFPDSELLKYVYSDSKNYDLIMDYVDQTPGLKDQFKKSIVDAFIGDFSRGSVISPSDISREFGKLNRSVVEDLLGPRYEEKLDFLKEISSMSSREWGKLSPQDVYANQAAVDSFLRNPVSAKTKMVLKDSMKDYAEKAQSLKRNLRQRITEENIDDVIEKDGLAGILIDSATPKQIGQFVKQIGNGQKRQALEYKTVEELLRRSGMYNPVARHHAVKAVSYQPEIVGKSLYDELNKPAYREIFSPDLYSKLDDLATFLTYRDKAFERFGSNAASLSSGDNISGFLTTLISPKKWAAALDQTVGYKIAAAFLASPKARAVLTSPFFRKDSKSLVALLTSNTLISNEIVSLLGDSPVALKDLSKALVALEDVPPETRLLDELSEPEQDTQPQPQPQPEPAQQ